MFNAGVSAGMISDEDTLNCCFVVLTTWLSPTVRTVCCVLPHSSGETALSLAIVCLDEVNKFSDSLIVRVLLK